MKMMSFADLELNEMHPTILLKLFLQSKKEFYAKEFLKIKVLKETEFLQKDEIHKELQKINQKETQQMTFAIYLLKAFYASKIPEILFNASLCS